METEKGVASILVTLEDGYITVYHGTDKVQLYQKVAKEGDWDKVWEAIKE